MGSEAACAYTEAVASDRAVAPTPPDIRALDLADLDAAAAVLGRGMRDNPLHRRVFGDDPARREADLTRFFEGVLRQHAVRGVILGAFLSGRLAGVCGSVQPGRCQPTLWQRIALAPLLMGRSGVGVTLRVARWASSWSRHDPGESHWHLGPVAVDRDLQGRGIGRAMLGAFCRRMDEGPWVSYLETDKPENVAFYEPFGFQVVGDQLVLGVPNWFMVRTP